MRWVTTNFTDSRSLIHPDVIDKEFSWETKVDEVDGLPVERHSQIDDLKVSHQIQTGNQGERLALTICIGSSGINRCDKPTAGFGPTAPARTVHACRPLPTHVM
jgi:hypothetical protein